MKLSLNKLSEKLIWLLTVLIVATYVAFQVYTWRRYVYFSASVVIFVLAAFDNKWRITIKFEPYYGFMLLFSGYCYMSSLWAMSPGDSMQMGETIFQILCCNMMLYVYYQNENNIEKLLSAVMWAGYIASIYTISFYGLDEIANAAENRRLGLEFANVNNIGIAVAVSCVIQVHELMYNQHRKSAPFMILNIIVIAACQSKTAIVLLVLGVLAVYFLKNWYGKKNLNRLMKFALSILCAIGIMVVLYSLPIFDGIRERMDSMFLGMLGKGVMDNSTWERMRMMELGWEWFKRFPVGGIGIGNAHILVSRYIGVDTYMHNNYMELLCSGGIVGFVIYYAMYFYLFRNLLRYKNADRKHFEICFVLMVLMLIMDYGVVSYYDKAQWFYLMVHFLNVFCLKKKSVVMKNAAKKAD